MKTAKPATLLACLLALLCAGWGYEGHRIVGEIAWSYLTPAAKAAVVKLLESDGDGTLSEAATWADRIKSDRKWDWAKPLHYANVQPGAKFFDLKRDCPESGCVVSAIIKYRDVLRDAKATDAKKLEALKFLAHFVGDVHQPLHVSRAKDRGGNDISVEFNHNRTNLHRLWDSGLIRFNGVPWSAYAKSLRESIKTNDLQAWKAIDPIVWANESYKLALSHAYEIPTDRQLGPEYVQRNLPVIERRLKMAGVRLAALLNAVYATQPEGDPAP